MKREYLIQNILKSFAIMPFFIIISIIVYTYYHPAVNYELSIYENMPLSVWFFLIFNNLAGLVLIFYQIGKNDSKKWIWISGLLILLLNRLTLQWLPFIRGYYTFHGDHMTHLGIIREIIFSGHVSSENFYPVTHILISSIILISNSPLVDVANYSTALISILGVILIYVLSKPVLDDQNARIIALTSAIVILFDGYSLYLMPNGWSIFLIPIVFYLFFRDRISNNVNYKITLLIVIIMYPFFHLLTAVYLIAAFFIVGFAQYYICYIQKSEFILTEKRNAIPINLISVLFIAFFMWIISFRLFSQNIRFIYLAITTGNDPSRYLDLVNMGISKLALSMTDFFWYIFKLMGHDLILFSISAFSFIYFINSKDYRKTGNFPLLALFAVSGFGFFLYLGRIFGLVPGLGAIGGERFISYVGLFVPIFVGYWDSRMLYKKKLFRYTLCVFVIFLASIISIFAFFPSPNLYVPSPHVTYKDVSSFDWTFAKIDGNTSNLLSIISSPSRFSDLILGASRTQISPYQQTQDHFGYRDSDLVGKSVSANTYLILNQIDKIVYSTVWRNVGRFYANDFMRLYNDYSISKLYTNGGDDVWFIQKS